MRTWSVRGTAFALCTRSSSLSMSTRTSIRSSLLLGAYGSAGFRLREQLPEPLRDGCGNEGINVSTKGRDLLHARGRDEAELRIGYQVGRLDLRRERPVEMVHLELPLEVGDRAQPLDHRSGAVAAREVDDQLRELRDLDVTSVRQRVLDEANAVLDREHRRLVRWFAHDGDDDAVEDRGGTADDVQMAVRDRVVRARTDRHDRVPRAHGDRPIEADAGQLTRMPRRR